MRRRTALLAVLAVFAATFTAGGPLGAQTPDGFDSRSGPERIGGSVSDGFEVRSPDDVVQVFIQFDEPSVAEFAAARNANPTAQRAQGRTVRAQQDRVTTGLGGMIVEELSSMVVAANGIRALVRAGDIPTIRSTDGVKSVAPVTRYHLLNETSVPWIGGSAVQAAGFTGAGITIAIIDTGIDYTHAALGGTGTTAAYAAIDPTNDAPLFNAKVIGGTDFAGPTYDASDPANSTPAPDDNPLDVNGHGTHVAATAAGLATGGDVGRGMAPGAQLYALKVFGDVAGSTDLVSDAIEWALDPDGDDSTDDAVDVINMSLGASFGHPDDPSAIASQNAVDNGVVVVASAGNSGAVPYVTGAPAVADGAISVAASIDGGLEVLAMTVNSPARIADNYEAAGSDFGALDPPITNDLAVAAPLDACTPLTNDAEIHGDITLIQRGGCTFTTKVRHAQAAGATGALVFNNVDGPPFTMGHDDTDPKPTIPAMMVGLADGTTILDTVVSEPVTVTLRADITIPKPEVADFMAGFTSRGPGTNSVFKPDLSAPGFSIGSAAVGTGGGLALSSGTSMAAPHVAGAAAQLLQANPDLSPAKVKALFMNSARPALDDAPLASQGTGVIQVGRAVLDLGGYAMPAGLSFGRINPAAAGSRTETIAVTRFAGDATYDVELVPQQTLPGVTWSVSANTVATSGGTGSVNVTLTYDPKAMDSDDGSFSQSETDGWVVLTNQSDPDDQIVVGLLAVVDPASVVSATAGNSVDIANTGPGDGFADGFTKVSDGDGTLAAVGYRTGDGEDSSYRTIDLGVALTAPWSSPSSQEVDVFIDVDQDGAPDYVVVSADLGFLTGGNAVGQVVTALFDLNEGGGFLLYFAIADLNDHVIVLPADLTGDFGFLGDETSFDIFTVVYDQLGLAGISDTVTVDLGAEITSAGGLSLAVPAGASGTVETEGSGEMLWLFQNNAVPGQFATVVLEEAEPPPPPPPPPGEPPSFDDVPEGHLFHTEITWLAEQGITRGCNPPDNTLFCPDDPVTRGQMAAFLNRALELPSTAEDFFVDDDTSVFEGDINRLAASGITRGCNPPTNDEYCPLRTLTRAEMATFMVRGFGFSDGAGDDLFVDDDGNIHESAIDVLGTAGVTRGCNPPTNDRYCPDRDITRGEMAAFIYRAYRGAGLDVKASGTLSDR